MQVRDRRLPGGGAGNGLDACRLAGALPGLVLLVASAKDRASPEPLGPVASSAVRGDTLSPTPDGETLVVNARQAVCAA